MRGLNSATILVLFFAISLVPMAAKQKPKRSTEGTGHRQHVIMVPDEMKWGPASPALPPGAQMAILQGDPSKRGASFTIRAKFPDGYRVPAHWHPTDENISVIQGTLMMGLGDTFDEASTRELPAGSYGLMPKGVRHFAMAKGETVSDIYGLGPFDIIYVNPKDDPRKAK